MKIISIDSETAFPKVECGRKLLFTSNPYLVFSIVLNVRKQAML